MFDKDQDSLGCLGFFVGIWQSVFYNFSQYKRITI